MGACLVRTSTGINPIGTNDTHCGADVLYVRTDACVTAKATATMCTTIMDRPQIMQSVRTRPSCFFTSIVFGLFFRIEKMTAII